jgi:hypothetical protein
VNKDNPVPPREVDSALFAAMPEAVKRLDKQARKELREQARKQFARTHRRNAAP